MNELQNNSMSTDATQQYHGVFDFRTVSGTWFNGDKTRLTDTFLYKDYLKEHRGSNLARFETNEKTMQKLKI